MSKTNYGIRETKFWISKNHMNSSKTYIDKHAVKQKDR